MVLRVRQNLGKYYIEKKLAEGGSAVVYQALDRIEGIRIALKVPHSEQVNAEFLEDFRKEVRLTASLDHVNILPLKYAGFIERQFVVVFPLGERSLAERIQSRLSLRSAFHYAEQMLEAVAYAHKQGIIHCDIKPENLILFSENRLRLTDFGIAKVAQKNGRAASGSGTIGYIAPEQAMGKPTFRSDVFSLGLVTYRMFSGRLPEWPFEWPLPGYSSLRTRLHSDLIEFLRKALQLDQRKRFADAGQMLLALRKIKPRALRDAPGTRRRRVVVAPQRDWRTVRQRQFLRHYGTALRTRFPCTRCKGPVAESMKACAWCGHGRAIHRHETRFPASCTRCRRGMKLDWSYCPWCYGPGYEPLSTRQFTDSAYEGRCTNHACKRKLLMPFMRYCPWCRKKVKRTWKIAGSSDKCSSCGWGVLRMFWSFCPWCTKTLTRR